VWLIRYNGYLACAVKFIPNRDDNSQFAAGFRNFSILSRLIRRQISAITETWHSGTALAENTLRDVHRRRCGIKGCMMLSISGCFGHAYDGRLVVLAAFICVIACFTTVSLLARAQLVEGRLRGLWLGASALIFGSGVWSLHFVAMLAFMPGFPISYDLFHTSRSICVAIVGAGVSMAAREICDRRGAKILFGGVLLGTTIAAMHYDGVAAIRLSGSFALNPGRTWLSICVGVAFCLLAFARASDLSRLSRKVEASAYLGVAVLGVHFVGMAALTIFPGRPGVVDGAVLGSGTLALAVGAISVAIILAGMVGAVTDQRLSFQAQREANRLRQLADASFEGIVIHCDGVIFNANEAFAKMVGCDVGALAGHASADFVSPKDQPRLAAALNARGPGGRIEFELQALDGHRLPVEVLSRTIEYKGRMAYVSAIRDLSERKRSDAIIQHLAHHDALTGLCNRLLLNDRLAQMIALASRDGKKVAVHYVDLDRFKPVNDLLGHEAGDALLIEIAGRLRSMTRSSDTIARVGGDEFVVVQTLGDAAGPAEKAAARIIAELSKPFYIAAEELQVGASIGIALYPDDGQTAAELLRNADKAMYRAKHEAPGTFRTFTPGLDFRIHRMRVMEHDLRHAIARNELEVYYQPIFDGKKKILGHEALLRWNHPTRGMVSPAEFIPVAEESGLICELGNWVLETACNAAMTWPLDWRIAVNVSAKQFQDADYLQTVVDTLARTHLPATRLELEITESLLIGDTTKVLPILIALKQHGIHISLDDFGTGFSSLNYLHRFPFEKIKIDRSFIANLGQSAESEKIVRAIIALGHSLHMTVTAEGVETQSQFHTLDNLECDQIQGYLLGRPMPKAAVDQILEKSGNISGCSRAATSTNGSNLRLVVAA
jgi:diguanylate cyclase (GGDEF)-like protein/PAS domain S-box-containing protein